MYNFLYCFQYIIPQFDSGLINIRYYNTFVGKQTAKQLGAGNLDDTYATYTSKWRSIYLHMIGYQDIISIPELSR